MILEKVGKLNDYQETGQAVLWQYRNILWSGGEREMSGEDDLGIDDLDI